MGQRLYQDLMRVNRFCLANGKNLELTRYKFFTEMIDELLISYRACGANIFSHVMEIRKNLLLDVKAEKKLASMARSGCAEMLIIAGMCLCFVAFARFVAQINIPMIDVALALGWQGAGAIVFFGLQQYIRQKIFSPFYAYVSRANLLDIFIKTNRPVNIIAQRLSLETLAQDASLSHLGERMALILAQIKENGIYDQEQTKELSQECWFCYEQKLADFTAKIKKLKLAIISLFFLTAYLYLFYALLSSAGAGH